jgi:hypothetical protein
MLFDEGFGTMQDYGVLRLVPLLGARSGSRQRVHSAPSNGEDRLPKVTEANHEIHLHGAGWLSPAVTLTENQAVTLLGRGGESAFSLTLRDLHEGGLLSRRDECLDAASMVR